SCLVVGCPTLLGFDDLSYGVCETATHACVAVPDGWTGPLAISIGSGAAAVACAGRYDTGFGHYFSGLVADEGRCECACGAPEGTECTAAACITFNCNQFCGEDTVL